MTGTRVPSAVEEPLAVQLLQRYRRIAVVGMSGSPGKDAYDVPAYLAAEGYAISPVNPTAAAILGKPPARTLAEAERPLDLVAIFRPSAEAAQHVRHALALGARAIWLPQGVASAEGRALADAAGVPYVENTCLRTVYDVYLG